MKQNADKQDGRSDQADLQIGSEAEDKRHQRKKKAHPNLRAGESSAR